MGFKEFLLTEYERFYDPSVEGSKAKDAKLHDIYPLMKRRLDPVGIGPWTKIVTQIKSLGTNPDVNKEIVLKLKELPKDKFIAWLRGKAFSDDVNSDKYKQYLNKFKHFKDIDVAVRQAQDFVGV
jgi:hypothetical protein